ncbi:MAG: hypothetical protein ACKVHE_32705 [Planctomycetales bacterium]|jgi:hypothetical protein
MSDSVRFFESNRWRVERLRRLLSLSFYIVLLGVVDCATAPVSGPVASEIFGEPTLAQNVRAVRSRADELPDKQAFNLLVSWVLPDAFHSSFRLTGEFT